jgi:serine/threonine protein kinase
MGDGESKEEKIQKMQISITEDRELMNMLKRQGKNENQKELQNFRDFLEKFLALNPKYRITPQSAIEHPFLHFQTKLQE